MLWSRICGSLHPFPHTSSKRSKDNFTFLRSDQRNLCGKKNLRSKQNYIIDKLSGGVSIVILLDISLSWYALLNASRRAASILVPSNFGGLTHVPIVNREYSYGHSFCATGESNGLVIMATVTAISRGKLREYIYKEVQVLISLPYHKT